MYLFLLALLAAPASPAAPPPAIAPLTSTEGPFEAIRKGTVGVNFSMPGGGAPTIGATYFVADNMAARVDFGLNATFAPSGTPAGFSLTVGLRFYQAKRGPVALYLAPVFGFGRDPATSTELMNFAGAVGVEYFFAEHLSVGGQFALGLALTNIGGPAGSSVGSNLSTGSTGLFANVYF